MSDNLEYETIWTVGNVNVGEDVVEGSYILIGCNDKARLEVALRAGVDEDAGIDPEYFLERLEATHYFISATMPEGSDPSDTWHDFSATLAKQVDGEWYYWSEDPSDIGNIWYQSTYTRSEALGMRDEAIRRCMADELLVNNEDATYPHDTDLAGAFYRWSTKYMGW